MDGQRIRLRGLPGTPIRRLWSAVWLALSVADDILDLQRAFDEAELSADVARLGDLLAEDFLSIGEQGFVLGKREWIGRHGEFR
jgi:hypothetical protein